MKKIGTGRFKRANGTLRKTEKPPEMHRESRESKSENPYCYRYNDTDVKISFSGKQSFESCLWAAVTGSDKNAE